jgi:2'-5' RNA ligase
MSESYRDHQRRIVNQLRNGTASKASIVPMRAEHATDPAVCLTSVVFVPTEMGQQIYHTLVEPLQAIEPGHHYYRPEAMHLTIKNVRRINDPPRFTQADIHRVDQLFSRLIPRHASFFLSLEEVVSFATSAAMIGYSDERLGKLVQALDAGLKRIGLPDDKQYVSDTVFFGNVTLCRYGRQPSGQFFERLSQLAEAYRGILPVKEIDLISCNAVCLPESRTAWQSYRLRNE